MSELLEKMIDNKNNSEIEICILWVLDDAENWSEDCAPYEHAKKAAAELEAINAEKKYTDDLNKVIADQNTSMQQRIEEEETRNKLFSDCLHRGLQLWKKANPEREDWISGDANIAWMLERIDALEAEIGFFRRQFPTAAKNYKAVLKGAK